MVYSEIMEMCICMWKQELKHYSSKQQTENEWNCFWYYAKRIITVAADARKQKNYQNTITCYMQKFLECKLTDLVLLNNTTTWWKKSSNEINVSASKNEILAKRAIKPF